MQRLPANGELGGSLVAVSAVMGVDACKRGWIGVVLRGGFASALFAPKIREIALQAREMFPIAVIAVDIPIGLPDAGPRQADMQAQRLLGARAGSVFHTPVRAALAADDRANAAAINQEQTGGRGISAQAFALRRKIHEVEAWMPHAEVRVAEVHPEVSFAVMAGRPLPSKKTWAGTEQRRHALAQVGIDLPSELGAAGSMAGVDDILDAAAAAWTATRLLDGTARCIPDPPEIFSDGLVSAIWY